MEVADYAHQFNPGFRLDPAKTVVLNKTSAQVIAELDAARVTSH